MFKNFSRRNWFQKRIWPRHILVQSTKKKKIWLSSVHLIPTMKMNPTTGTIHHCQEKLNARNLKRLPHCQVKKNGQENRILLIGWGWWGIDIFAVFANARYLKSCFWSEYHHFRIKVLQKHAINTDKEISTSIWSAEYPNADQNIQH